MESEQTPIPFDQLAAPAQRALTAAGYTTLEQIAAVPENELAELHGVGPSVLETLRTLLAEQGLSFTEAD